MKQKKEIFDLDIEVLNLPEQVTKKLKKHNLSKVEDIVSLTEKDFLAIKGLGKDTFNVTKLALKINKLAFKKEEKVKDPNSPTYKLIVEKFLGWKKDQIIWGSELRLAKKLFEINQNILNINLDFKINSLAFFLTFNGRKELEKTREFTNKEVVREISVKPIDLTEYKIGEDIITTKRKSVRDFLNE